jgi:hypothetical protein
MPFEILRHAWTRYYLSHLTELFLVVLALVAIYEAYFSGLVLVRLYLARNEEAHPRKPILQTLCRRSECLQRTIFTMLCLFLVMFFVQIGNAFNTPENNRPTIPFILEGLRVYFRFASAVFLIILLLHLVQWFLTSRIQKALRSP